jgi:hypothetical protein
MSWQLIVALVLAELAEASDCVTTNIGLAIGGKEANPLFNWMPAEVAAIVQWPLKLGLPILFTWLSYHFEGNTNLNLIMPGIFIAIGAYAGIKNYILIKEIESE